MTQSPIYDQTVTIDCGDANVLATFYSKLLGWKKYDHPEWPCVGPEGDHPRILFQKIEDYIPPVWPEEPGKMRQMMHFDFAVRDLEEGGKHAIACGATLSPRQYSDRWTVYFDPEGHPFCLIVIDE
ncbi:MAG: VOC family protein [Oscillospiraceae bacterium]